ncbi:cell cycle checkpoint protein RAD17 isoform X2 [Diachasma alloeum]|uniref:cell cycle checkpoint protein RAD17 isoform X2 n=1 Tax=Diachasma alloeum TaxID=454923 RepID=UPI0007382F00|nr:cell cycle checkpoint protein RAD17 isoform X2 [Diachasma alloeum]
MKKMSHSGWAELNLDFQPSKKKLAPIKSDKTSNNEIIETFAHDFEHFDYKSIKRKSLFGILEACQPKKASELSVSKQKQNEIIEWLSSETVTGKPRILLLSGASGCGKTVTLKVLAEENDFDVIEWISPMDSTYSNDFKYLNQGDKFMEFLVRVTRYNSVFNRCKKRLLLVKDIPNIYFMDTDGFHEVLRQYMELGKQPLVFLCPDSESSRMIYTLFPTEIIEKFQIDRINILPTTPTAMRNMLKRVANILNARFGDMIDVTQTVIDEVLSNSIGDVRSTILNTIFASLKVPNDHSKNDCGTRAESLGLLHGIGRVINPKRIVNGDKWKFTHDPDDIAAYFRSQSKIFFHFLQENYLNTMGNIDQVERCSEIMSLADTISIEYREANLINVNLSLCIRGVMVNNETPLMRWNPVRKPKKADPKIQRDSGVAEERFYKQLINPKMSESTLGVDYNIEN